MHLKRGTSTFHRIDEMERFVRELESDGYRSSVLASQILHRSYSIQRWTGFDKAAWWRVEWHAHGVRGR